MDQPTPSGPTIADPPTKGRLPITFLLSLVTLSVIIAMIVYYRVNVLTLGLIVFGLGALIFVHELGHFLAAKWCDVHVEVFSIGFGPAIPGCAYQRGETLYMVGALPLGGYVKMVGEGAESEEGEDDPRSFKNKSVGQRMLIISAGVIMNVLTAALIFVGVYMTSGIPLKSGLIGFVDAGSPAWIKGVPTDVRLLRIGKATDPHFEDVFTTVALSQANQKIPLTYEGRDGQPVSLELDPRVDPEDAGRPQIGIGPVDGVSLYGFLGRDKPPVIFNSPAVFAHPPLKHDDMVIATTAPSLAGLLRGLEVIRPTDGPWRDLHAAIEAIILGQVETLPLDPRQPGSGLPDNIVLHRRLRQFAGAPIALKLQRGTETVLSRVPPAFAGDLGLRMRMGAVAAIMMGSPADRAGIQPKTAQSPGDVLNAVEATDGQGHVTRWLVAAPADADPSQTRELDPMRLPAELDAWVRAAPAPRRFKLTLVRSDGHNERATVVKDIDWTDDHRDDRVRPGGHNSPMAISGFGLAYRVETAVEKVQPGSVAESAGIKPNDVIKAITYYIPDDQTAPLADGTYPVKPEERESAIKPDQWAHFGYLYTISLSRKVSLRIERPSQKEPVVVELNPPLSHDLPLLDRGLFFGPDQRRHIARTPLEALTFGSQQTFATISQMVTSIQSLATGRIKFSKNAAGPLQIASSAYGTANESFPRFLLLLATFSINLAVINFLPIPVLDGGHMVFLIYEKLTGKPPSETVRATATIVGLVLIGSLMLYVWYLDFWRASSMMRTALTILGGMGALMGLLYAFTGGKKA